mmetsp:Transcript_9505/g.24823  ORF Transcript_9505/g.24823 Transcript_9505/m.24823 type:complete len:217 (-) Transcript_9505:27-677(-)
MLPLAQRGGFGEEARSRSKRPCCAGTCPGTMVAELLSEHRLTSGVLLRTPGCLATRCGLENVSSSSLQLPSSSSDGGASSCCKFHKNIVPSDQQPKMRGESPVKKEMPPGGSLCPERRATSRRVAVSTTRTPPPAAAVATERMETPCGKLRACKALREPVPIAPAKPTTSKWPSPLTCSGAMKSASTSPKRTCFCTRPVAASSCSKRRSVQAANSA